MIWEGEEADILSYKYIQEGWYLQVILLIGGQPAASHLKLSTIILLILLITIIIVVVIIIKGLSVSENTPTLKVMITLEHNNKITDLVYVFI